MGKQGENVFPDSGVGAAPQGVSTKPAKVNQKNRNTKPPSGVERFDSFHSMYYHYDAGRSRSDANKLDRSIGRVLGSLIGRHEKIWVEKSVILKRPTCPTNKARRYLSVISLFYNLFWFYLLIPIKIDRACDTETEQKKRDPLLYRNRLLN